MKQQFISYGKFILAGEHAVLRGVPALVFPVKSKYILMQWQEHDKALQVDFLGTYADELKIPFWAVLEESLKKIGKAREQLTGQLKLTVNIPLGAGLGASACLCVSIAKLFQYKGWLKEDELYQFSKSLEDIFHGQSSGVDVAIALHGKAIEFHTDGSMTPIKQNWEPLFYLSYSGQKGITAECVKQVKDLFESNHQLAISLDQTMAEAERMAKKALIQSPSEGLKTLDQAMCLSESCFVSWGLIKGVVGEHIEWLKANGALAAKPTGSGGGGYILSLWHKTPPDDLKNTLIQP